MFKISIIETIIIGLVTIICGLFIQIIIDTFGEEEIKENNIFSKNKKSIIFYIILFIIGISIHFLMKYAEVNKWYCEKSCVYDKCEILCHLPINDITNLIITK
jgi:hypothetical protein